MKMKILMVFALGTFLLSSINTAPIETNSVVWNDLKVSFDKNHNFAIKMHNFDDHYRRSHGR